MNIYNIAKQLSTYMAWCCDCGKQVDDFTIFIKKQRLKFKRQTRKHKKKIDIESTSINELPTLPRIIINVTTSELSLDLDPLDSLDPVYSLDPSLGTNEPNESNEPNEPNEPNTKAKTPESDFLNDFLNSSISFDSSNVKISSVSPVSSTSSTSSVSSVKSLNSLTSLNSVNYSNGSDFIFVE